MVILYKTSRSIRTLADSRMSWSRTILALRLQCLEPKEGKKATIQFISLVFRQTHQETNCLSPRELTKYHPFVADHCSQLVGRLVFKPNCIVKISPKDHLTQQLSSSGSWDNLNLSKFPTDFNRLGVGVTTNTEITHHLHRTSSATKWHWIRAVYLSLPWQMLFMR